ncbi:cytochrome P450 [Mollisia scopiformis]|uniref:Cytochrome P450 n=1 Tax=Mollisia scopiformis TaxID=149040 RepID=A0A132BD47_MOLSC|nr:cytochrome P450 [Mollisia scopiformis]KUJ10352.1 cytochrome P450 [Mollisia scopiformis]
MISLFQALPSLSASTVSTVVILLLVSSYTIWASRGFRFSSKSPKRLREGYPIFGALRFFTARWDFFQQARAQTPTGNFTFFVGKHPVIGLTGEKPRQAFFQSRDLDFTEGYAVLFGQSPADAKKADDVHVPDEDSNFTGPGGFFNKRMTHMISSASFGRNLPKLLKDVRGRLDDLKNDPTGLTDPFKSIYMTIYQLTMRMVGCDDIADDPELLMKTLQYYEKIDGSATPIAVMYPWFPSPAVVKRTYAAGQLYMIVNKIVEDRAKTGKKRDDPLQYLIEQGDSMYRIIEFIIGALFAGLLNSGINTAWVLTYLANDAHWRSEVRKEVESVAAKYSTNRDAPLIDQLAEVPFPAWESEFPLIDFCLKDSIRIQALGTAFRKNVTNKSIPIGTGDEVIDPGAIVTYHLGDVHLDPEIYPNPKQWDPSRYLPEKAEDKKKPFGYLGWGVGRHPCLGMRFAKLENNVIIAMFTAMFDYELADKAGKPVQGTPEVDFNGKSAMKPRVRPYVKYTSRD